MFTRSISSTRRWHGPAILVIASILLAPLAALGQPATIQPSAAQQMATLLAEKAARTPSQQKIDSRLLLARASALGNPMFDALPGLRVQLEAEQDGRILLDIHATVDAALLAQIEGLGGIVVNAHARFNAIRARLPLSAVEALAGFASVRTIRPADVMMPQMTNTTEGDVAHAADTARTTFNVDGTGVSACAMSDSVDALAALQASGDLPPGVTVLPGQSGNPGTSEGTALLEIIHDMAPGADLFFATGAGGSAQMAQNILDLAAAGCDVIVDDVLYLAEGVFQDDNITQAVEAVVADGVTYVTSAGNSGNLTAGTSGVFEGDYTPTALPAPLVGAALSAHDFGGGDPGNTITFDPPVLITMQWADPLDAATNDYDLFLLDPTLTNVLAASTNTQNGTQDPLEFILSAGDDTGNRLVATLFNGTERFIHLNTHRGMLATGTNGQIFGHPAAKGAITVAAVNVATAGGGVFTGGPANPPEFFSSDGPRRVFFAPDGTPLPLPFGEDPFGDGGAEMGDSDCPEDAEMGDSDTDCDGQRDKPDVTAADGVMTATPGFNPFFGTSASAPHTAGIAALLKQFMSSLSPTGVKERMENDALDIGAAGTDDVAGNGIAQADSTLDGKKGFDGDLFSFLMGLLDSNGNCITPQTSGTGDNSVLFDGLEEFLDTFTNGTQPTIKETQSDPDQSMTDVNMDIESLGGEDLFPEGFEDPDTGTPLDTACIEIGIDDTLDNEENVFVTSAVINAFNNGTNVFSSDITSIFSNPFDGTMSVNFPGTAGQGINEIKLTIETQPSTIFADGFESGDASAWTDQVP